jgi:propionyl-CoA synthetase
MKYADMHRWSVEEPENFWAHQAAEIDWHTPPNTVLKNLKNGHSDWFVDGKLNNCYLAIDHHIKNGRGEEVALVYDSPVTQTIQSFTYNDMCAEVSSLAGGLKKLGIGKGDTVIVYMPMIPQAAFSMLACARLGAIHSVVFGGFAAQELAIRIDDCHPKAIITASSGIEVDRIIPYKPIVDEAMHLAQHKPEHMVVFNRQLGANRPDKVYDVDYRTLVKVAEPVEALPVEATHPLYILYTSGTTGKPKGIVRDHGGHAVALNFSMKYIYNMQVGETFWAASDVGWVVGHSYIVYAPLIYGCRTLMFEGKPVRTPDAGTFWRVIEEHQVKVLFTAPTAIRAIRQEDHTGELAKAYDLGGLRTLFLAGERCDSSTLEWARELLQRDVVDHWWQTESGWPMLANPMGVEKLEVPSGSAGKAVMGYDIKIMNPVERYGRGNCIG